MNGNFRDLTGQKFGHLTVIKFGERTKSGAIKWWCQCDCGNEELKLVIGFNLKNNKTKSCGCLLRKSSMQNGKNSKKYNQYDLTGEYGIGYTSKGEEFYFDLEDYDKIKNYCWYIDKDGYVINKSNNTATLMHRLVMNVKENLRVDHIYHNKNDNRKQFLRICTPSQNSMNADKPKNNTSGFRGVTWDKRTSKWIAIISMGRKNIYLGSFINFYDAVKAREEGEKLYFGEFAFKNNK
jgi:hypothetical protein